MESKIKADYIPLEDGECVVCAICERLLAGKDNVLFAKIYVKDYEVKYVLACAECVEDSI